MVEREMSLEEWVGKLPKFHRAYKEWQTLKSAEAVDNSVQQLKAEIAALRQVTPLCPDLCKEYNQAIDDVLNLRQLSAV